MTSKLLEPLLESPIVGKLSLELDGLWVAESLLPMDLAYELDDIRGVMLVGADVRGTLSAPLIDGTLSLQDAGWRILALNAGFDAFNLDAELQKSQKTQQLTFSGGGRVGDGSLSLSGELTASDEQAQLTSRFVLDQAQVVALPDYSAVLDGRVDLTMSTESLQLDGALEISEATIRIAELPETAIAVSEDEVVTGAPVTGRQQIRSTDLTVTLGESVMFDAFGLSARLSGNIRLRESPGRLQEVSGVISLHEGLFEAYGQSLTVERGRLTFSGPLDDPAVDVVAVRVVEYQGRDYRISLNITGTAQHLTTVVRSVPTLPEDDALALLITGQTFSQISSTEQTNVYGAALSLGLLGATGITQSMASSLGLEEIILDSDRDGNLEVGAAVRLNKDIYLRYTYGVFSRLGGVLLRYRLNRRFSVQARSGDAHSIEIRYGVDD
jgi:translocation and assembly module TamB